MKNFTKFTILATLLISVALQAQGRPKLEIDIQESKVNMTAAEISGDSPVAYAPGDTILYTVYAKNTGDGAMTNATVVDPIPENVVYVIGSATGDNCRIIYSVNDGMQFSVWPIMVTAADANGTPIQREARKEQVTHIKWLIQESIPAGGQKTFTFRVVVK